MTKQEALNYCYEHEYQYKSDLYENVEDGQSQFDFEIRDSKAW